MSESIPQWERELLEREALLADLEKTDPRLARFLRALHERVRELEHQAEDAHAVDRISRWNDAMEAREREPW